MKAIKIGHLTPDDYEFIYEPAEDSFILLDALEQDAGDIRATKPTICIEIGSGSGIVSTFLGKILLDSSVLITSDINSKACAATQKTGDVNGVRLDPVQCDLLGPLLARVAGRVDLLMFNPPYVPTSSEELSSTQYHAGIGGAWAGGPQGMDVTQRVLSLLPRLLSPQGRCYLVAVEQNRPLQIIADIQQMDLQADICLKRRAGIELLYVIRVTNGLST